MDDLIDREGLNILKAKLISKGRAIEEIEDSPPADTERHAHCGRMKLDKKSIDVTHTINDAIRFVKSSPCYICKYYNSDCQCIAGIKYKGTCEVYHKILGELLKLREIDEVNE